MAIEVLEKYGGYDATMDSSEDLDEDNSQSDQIRVKEPTFEHVSLLDAKSMMLTGCLEGDNNADRFDWKDAVTSCKTISR